MAAREDLRFEVAIESDSAPLWPSVRELLAALGAEVHALRDPTRGGVASALNEIAAAARVGVVLDEQAIPVPDPVRAACEMLGLDPLYVANEGVLLAIVPEACVELALGAIRSHPVGALAAAIGRVVAQHPGYVALETALGGSRVIDLLPGDQLPRIC
jgi:hydrogenase expression/formation protein HypE